MKINAQSAYQVSYYKRILMTEQVADPVELETSPPVKIQRKIVIDLSDAGLTYSIDDSLTLWEVLGAFSVVGDSLKNGNIAANRDVLIAINNKVEQLLAREATEAPAQDNKLLVHLLSEIQKFK